MCCRNACSSVACHQIDAGIVHWQPPEAALDRAAAALRSPSSSSYGPDEGNPELRQALRAKLEHENNLPGVSWQPLSYLYPQCLTK